MTTIKFSEPITHGVPEWFKLLSESENQPEPEVRDITQLISALWKHVDECATDLTPLNHYLSRISVPKTSSHYLIAVLRTLFRARYKLSQWSVLRDAVWTDFKGRDFGNIPVNQIMRGLTERFDSSAQPDNHHSKKVGLKED